ncbi:MAG: S24/S26 family peptidase [Clostridia bacterium]|nr:S24/S26 family peptidase [Clostridia bacterium]
MNNNEFYLADAIDIIEEVLAGGGEFRMYPKGTSMLPLLVQGEDSVILRRRKGIPAKKHDIIFYRRDNGQFILHRVLKVCPDDSYILCGDNQTLLEPNIRSEQIIGYVSGIYKKDRLLSTTSFSFRVYMIFWMWMPYRRMFLFIKRCFRFLKRRIGQRGKHRQ